jgi:transmembrane sensor
MVHEALTAERLDTLEARDAAAYFIARRSQGLSVSEQGLLDAWLAVDEAHRRALATAESAWRAFDTPGDDEILAAMRAHALAPRSRAGIAWRYATAAAAVVVLVAGAAWLLMPALKPGAQQVATGATVQYVSAHGAVRVFNLPDGSAMTLDADSAATSRFSATQRDIQLQRGRAFFAVAPDRSRPFSVTAAGQQVVAVGTRFDVDLNTAELTVTLLQGHVTVGQSPQHSILLEPGQRFVLRSGKASVQTLGAQAENAGAWRTGLIAFDDQTLAEAAVVMNRYARDPIVIRDPAVGAIRVSGQFRAGDTDRFAQTLAEMHGLRTVRGPGGGIELRPAK